MTIITYNILPTFYRGYNYYNFPFVSLLFCFASCLRETSILFFIIIFFSIISLKYLSSLQLQTYFLNILYLPAFPFYSVLDTFNSFYHINFNVTPSYNILLCIFSSYIPIYNHLRRSCFSLVSLFYSPK